MTHLRYIAGAYGLTLGLIAWLSIGAMLRLVGARRRLAAFEAADGRKRTRPKGPAS